MRAEPSYTYRCEAVRVVDGDTVVLAIDVGFRMVATMPVRLAGINTPELRDEGGREAREFVKAWVAAPEHLPLTVATAKDPEKYGRWLGWVTGADGMDLAEHLFLEGHAVRYYGGKR